MVDFDPILEPCLNLPPSAIHSTRHTYLLWLNNLGMITQSHCCNSTSFDDCVELWVISFLEISHMFPLVVGDIMYSCTSVEVKGQSIGLVTAIVDGESQSSNKVMNYIL